MTREAYLKKLGWLIDELGRAGHPLEIEIINNDIRILTKEYEKSVIAESKK
jgi:hypothetical protein